MCTLRFDLLTEDEEAVDEHTRHLRFDIGMLVDRLVGAARWVASQQHSSDAPAANRATNEQKSPRRGHGRIGAEHFTGAGAMAGSTVRAPRG